MSEIINRVGIGDSMQKHFIDYAMSVITDRALPDARDGLKPVQRRILYTLQSLGITPDKQYKKTARIVGEVLGKYHPHGDQSAYGSLVNMAQNFSMRYPLIDGHGNFGSIDGDSPAAMRYTEARLSHYGSTIMNDLNKNTVDFIPNFDGEETEPSVLSTLIPNMIANGNSGIAVGMATNMPPHNITDVYDALIYIIDKTIEQESIDEDEIIDIIKAPDFPTGGKIINLENIRDAYKEGQGRVVVRGTYEIENNNIIITEIPFKVNKSKLVERIDNLSRPSKEKNKPEKPAVISGIKEVRDESDKTGIRIVVELKKDVNPQIIINNLLKHSELQTNFNMNNTVLIDGQPKIVSLYGLLECFLAHSAEIILKRTAYDLEKASIRLNIIEGILFCCSEDNIGLIFNIFRESEDIVLALTQIGLNKEQAEYISEMKFKALNKKSEDKLTAEKDILITNINKYNSILNDQTVLLETLKFEYNELKTKFIDKRRTEIINESSSIDEEDLIKDETLIITITDTNLIKSVAEKEYNIQRRGGKGTKSANTKEDENVKYMFTANSKDNIMFFTNLGRVHLLKAFKIAKSNKNTRGKSIYNYISLDTENGESVVNVIAANTNDTSMSLLMVTKYGIIKRLCLENLSTRSSVTKVIEFKDKDSLKAVLLVAENDFVMINTSNGMALITAIEEDSIRATGRNAMGVKGIKFKKKTDHVVDASICNNKEYLLTITKNGLGKRSLLSDFTTQNRGGVGIIAHKLNEKTGEVVCAMTVNDNDDVFIATEQGQIIRVNASSVSVTGRATSGVKLVSLNNNDYISSASIMIKEENDEGTEE